MDFQEPSGERVLAAEDVARAITFAVDQPGDVAVDEIVKYVRLGTTGVEVSRVCLGCLGFGEPARGGQPWSLDEDSSRQVIARALELGINFFDTANMYSAGSSEEILGRALADMANRDEVVVATKLFNPMRSGPNAAGLSRKAIFTEIDGSLRRLGTDYVDLYQIHRFDPTTPVEETLEALHDVVKSGKVRYIGASSMWAWQFAKLLHTSERHGWTRFVTMQNHYNLLNREEEREMLPLCADAGIGVIPWSPLARGRLTRDWDTATSRSATDDFGKTLYLDSDRAIIDRVAALASRRGIPRAQVALAWVMAKQEVSAPIVGATKLRHIEDAVAATSINLSIAEIAELEESYRPHDVVGFV